MKKKFKEKKEEIKEAEFYLNPEGRISTLRETEYRNDRKRKYEELTKTEPTCPICMESNKLIKKFNCMHYIHEDCFIPLINKICPICRKEVKE